MNKILRLSKFEDSKSAGNSIVKSPKKNLFFAFILKISSNSLSSFKSLANDELIWTS